MPKVELLLSGIILFLFHETILGAKAADATVPRKHKKLKKRVKPSILNPKTPENPQP